MSTPLRARLAGTVLWSSGESFDGYALILLALPGTHASVSMDGTFPRARIPTNTVIPIQDGIYNQNSWLYRNADIEPPNTQYAAYFYDLNWVRIAPAGAAALFTISADPYTLVAPTLTAPTAAVVAPSPTTVPSAGSSILYISKEQPTGTKNGVNDTFTLSSSSYHAVDIRLNGVSLLQNTGYTVFGATLTMLPGYIPGATDTLEAIIYP